MGRAALHRGAKRTLHLFDSFEGLPEPSKEDGQDAATYSGNRATGNLSSIGQCTADRESVQTYLTQRIGIREEDIEFHVGWFQHTIPAATPSLGSIAVLRLDGDWYNSTKVCLDYLYPLVSEGGVVIFDDYYYWEGCAQAVDEFRAKHNITTKLQRIDSEACFWTKQTSDQQSAISEHHT